MSNSTNYITTTQDNTNLIPQSVPARYPILWSTNGLQRLSKLIMSYTSSSDQSVLPNGALAQNLAVVFSQATAAVDTCGGIDLETTFSIGFTSAVTNFVYLIQWLDADNGVYQEFNGTFANIAALVTFVNTNITTVAATQDVNEVTITPDVGTPNQLVRFYFSGLLYSQYPFTASNVPADVTDVFNALISSAANSTFMNYYTQILEGNLFYADLADSSSTKIQAQYDLAVAVEATASGGDNQKTIAISTSDTNILESVADTIINKLEGIEPERSLVAYYAGNNMISGLISKRFGLSNGNTPTSYQTVTGVTYKFLTQDNIESLYFLDPTSGNVSGQNCNYYDNTAGNSFFYPGITPSGLFFDITVLSDNIALDARYAQIQLLVEQSNAGKNVPYNQDGIDQMVAAIQKVMDTYLNNGYITVNSNGNSCIIDAPTFAEIQATGSNNFANRILTGVKIYYIPAGTINKTSETFVAVV